MAKAEMLDSLKKSGVPPMLLAYIGNSNDDEIKRGIDRMAHAVLCCGFDNFVECVWVGFGFRKIVGSDKKVTWAFPGPFPW